VLPIVLGFIDGTQEFLSGLSRQWREGHAASLSKTYDLLEERIAKRAAGVRALAEAHLEGSREWERLMRRCTRHDSFATS
jgi:hypothetical protein